MDKQLKAEVHIEEAVVTKTTKVEEVATIIMTKARKIVNTAGNQATLSKIAGNFRLRKQQ